MLPLWSGVWPKRCSCCQTERLVWLETLRDDVQLLRIKPDWAL